MGRTNSRRTRLRLVSLLYINIKNEKSTIILYYYKIVVGKKVADSISGQQTRACKAGHDYRPRVSVTRAVFVRRVTAEGSGTD